MSKNKHLLDFIIDKYEDSDDKWNNKITGNMSYILKEPIYDYKNRNALNKQATELENQGLLKITWIDGYRGYDIDKVTYPLSNMNKFCEIMGRVPKYIIIQNQIQAVDNVLNLIQSPWIKNYLHDKIVQLNKGYEEKDFNKTLLLLRCLEKLDLLTTPVSNKVFSNHSVGNSKLFKEKLQDQIITIARKYIDDIDEAMEDIDVLAQLNITDYTHELIIKGSLRFLLDEEEIETKVFKFGLLLNTQTLKNAVIIDNPQIKKIITIENKANFMEEPYDEGTLIVFTHGFPSPTEKIFLRNLYDKIKHNNVECYHSGDMDFGGVRIFQYIKNNIFPNLKPNKMDVHTMEKYMDYSEEISDSCLERLSKLEEPLLQELINFIIQNRRVLEQESYL